MGFLAGSGAASFRRWAEAWKLRDEVMARRAPLASILDDDDAANMANRVAREKVVRDFDEKRCFESRNKSWFGIHRYSSKGIGSLHEGVLLLLA